jgi:phage baseplate assembly protein W
MAIPINKNTNPLDINKRKFVGVKIPFEKSTGVEGYFESTHTTIDAVKENIRNLLYTQKGERIFQPVLGIGLENYLFENFTKEIEMLIKDDIENAFDTWLPFVTITKLLITHGGSEELTNGLENNKLNISIDFFINQNPSMMDSVQVTLG